jgi:hypothetical protein
MSLLKLHHFWGSRPEGKRRGQNNTNTFTSTLGSEKGKTDTFTLKIHIAGGLKANIFDLAHQVDP